MHVKKPDVDSIYNGEQICLDDFASNPLSPYKHDKALIHDMYSIQSVAKKTCEHTGWPKKGNSYLTAILI